MKYFLLTCLIGMLLRANAQETFQKPGKKVLVVSGGGARGAWGVGVVSSLYKTSGGYAAVFGTSTGSLMAAFVLLQQFDALDSAYSNVTQESIFNVNPFKVTYDPVQNTVTTKLRTFKIILRLIFGKKTFGESKNLLNLIHTYVTPEKFALLLDHYKHDNLLMGVAVTNTRTGGMEIHTDSAYSNSSSDYEEFCRWIWASANEPLFMSYVPMNGSSYVDGGVREVIPVQDALEYAVSHGIDSVDVIINNSKVPENQNWDVNAGGIMNGLERLLSIYNLGTVVYNENYASLIALYYGCAHQLPPTNGFSTAIVPKKVHLRFFCMPADLAAKYQDALGFVKKPMTDLIADGKAFGLAPQACFSTDLDENSILAARQIRDRK
jgi:NTE family protein